MFYAKDIITLYIEEVIDEFHMNLSLKKLKLRLTWKFSYVCFEVKIELFLW